MIELIFVIVILGILAAVAIPKLTATRDDAKVSREVSNLSTCVQDAGSKYTADGNISDINSSSSACSQLKCFTISSTADGNITVSPISSTTNDCPSGVLSQVKTVASNNGLLDSNGSSKTHSFGGSNVTY